MTRITGFITSALAAAVMTFTPLAPASAITMVPPSIQKQVVTSDVTTVQHRRFYRGHRGSRHHRPGWRRHNGWWYPPAAFALGLALGAGPRYVDPPRRYRGLPRAHYRWCDRNYRSYRAYDNSFIPRRGVRAECRSPYWP